MQNPPPNKLVTQLKVKGKLPKFHVFPQNYFPSQIKLEDISRNWIIFIYSTSSLVLVTKN